jgi:ACS family allantoate permease-like MFS transporter
MPLNTMAEEQSDRRASDGKSVADVEKETSLEETIRSGSTMPAAILKHGQDADEAMKAFASHEGEVIHIDEATNKKLLRKIDWNLMPVCELEDRSRTCRRH